MFLLILVLLSYFLSFQLFSFLRKETFDKIIEKIKLKLEEDEKIINTGFYTNSIIIISSLLITLSCCGLFVAEMKIQCSFLLLTTIILSLIITEINFKHIIVLTNKSVFFSYGKEPIIEQINIENIENSKYIWCFRPFLDIKLKNGEYKVISHMTNSKEINDYISKTLVKN